MQPSPRAATVPSGGGGAGGSGHRHLAELHKCTHTTRRRERARAKKDSALDPNHWSFHFMKESECLGSLQYLQCSAFSGARPEPRTTPAAGTVQGTMYRIYRESLQKSLLHPTTKCTLWCTCLRSENRDSSVCPPHPRGPT